MEPQERLEGLPGPWEPAVFRTQDALRYGPFYGRRVGDEEPADGYVIVPGGWDHEHCEICSVHISEDPRFDPHGFTNGEDWICRACGIELGLGSVSDGSRLQPVASSIGENGVCQQPE